MWRLFKTYGRTGRSKPYELLYVGGFKAFSRSGRPEEMRHIVGKDLPNLNSTTGLDPLPNYSVSLGTTYKIRPKLKRV